MKCEPFKAGDIAIFQNLSFPFNFLNGEECEVLASLQEVPVVDMNGVADTVACYKVVYRDMFCAALPEQLRHRKGPARTLYEPDFEPIRQAVGA